jgi:hypothetical protein
LLVPAGSEASSFLALQAPSVIRSLLLLEISELPRSFKAAQKLHEPLAGCEDIESSTSAEAKAMYAINASIEMSLIPYSS